MVRAGVTYRLVTDHLGSLRQVVNTSTGQIVGQIEYDEYGNVISSYDSLSLPFGFAGGLYDAQTKLLRFGARDYDASVGRWASKDPIRFNGGDKNLYVYVLNTPIGTVDPYGTFSNSAGLGLANSSAAASASYGQVLASVWGSEILGLIFAQAAITYAATEIIRHSLSNDWFSSDDEPASEKTAKDMAKQIGRDLGDQARRDFHDAKGEGNPDRTIGELREQAKEIYERYGKTPPKWMMPK